MTLTKTAKIPAASLKPAFSNTKNAVKPIQTNQNTPALMPFNDYPSSVILDGERIDHPHRELGLVDPGSCERSRHDALLRLQNTEQQV